MTQHVAGAKLVGGVWLPDTERHFVHMMETNTKNHRVVDGKLTYQYRKLEDAMNRIPKDRKRVCVDIGAHVGLWAMWLVRHFQHVHCFEPIPLHADILPHNMGTYDNYTLHRYALGEHSGHVAIEVPPNVTGNAHVVDVGEESATRPIKMEPLDFFTLGDDAVIEGPVDFIKIDVEGFELQVVRGAEQTLRKYKPYMVLEQKGNDQKFMGQQRNSALAWLQSIGMKSYHEIGGDHFLGW